jgi:Tn3 transposase DDE domain
VATRLSSDDQLEQPQSFPGIGKDDLIRFFTLAPADVAFVDPGRGRGPATVSAFRSSSARCPGLGSCRMRWLRRRRSRWRGWRSAWAWIWACWRSTAGGSRPAPVGKLLSPRIRDLGKITLVRDDTPAEIARRYPHAGPLLSARWNEVLVADCWPDLLRMAGLLRYGQAAASLVVGKWSAASRQNTLAAALKEWGTLRRTIHAAKYLSDPGYRRRIGRQLKKGESLHALRRDLHYAQQGTVAAPHLADQTEQAWCLTVLTNAVITWTTEYYQLAVKHLRSAGRDVPDEILGHISPAHSENINFFGVITVDVEAELAKLDTGGWRPCAPQHPTSAAPPNETGEHAPLKVGRHSQAAALDRRANAGDLAVQQDQPLLHSPVAQPAPSALED